MYVWMKVLLAALLVLSCVLEKKNVIDTEDASEMRGNLP